MVTTYRAQGTLADLVSTLAWPQAFFSADDPSFLHRIYVLDYDSRFEEGDFRSRLWLAFHNELSIGIPGFNGVRLVVAGDGGSGLGFLQAQLEVGERTTLEFLGVRLALRFSRDVMLPVDETGVPIGGYSEIWIEGTLRVTDQFDLEIDGFSTFSLPRSMIGRSGIVIAADDVRLDLLRTTSIPEVVAAGFDDSFIGVFVGAAQVTLPPGLPALAPEDLVLRKCAIGTGGVSGELSATYSPSLDADGDGFTGTGAGELFGMPFGLEEVFVAVRQNAFVNCRFAGRVLFPFFDGPLSVELGIGLDGGVMARIEATDAGRTLRVENVLKFEVDSVSFELVDGVFTAGLSGLVTPLLAEPTLRWPSFEIRELLVDSRGNVQLEGGWLDLPRSYTLDFHGFLLELSKIGFGQTEDGGRWMGFSGTFNLVPGLQSGGSVEGLRIAWYDKGSPKITLNGVGVEFEIPNTLSFKGQVSYRDIEIEGRQVHQFSGGVKVNLEALGVELDGQVVIGTLPDSSEPYLAVYLDAQLPAGIPIFGTGLGLYGIAGLFVLQREPDKYLNDDERWYAIDGHSWFHKPETGATDLAKWAPAPARLGLGAGVTIGTVADNGYAFNAKLLAVILFPGPVLMLEGRANILEERAALDDEPLFHALAVLDPEAHEFVFGLDARYRYDNQGHLIDIAGGVETFFGSPSRWYIHLGKDEPRRLRIRADVLRLFKGNAYWMLDPDGVAMGAWIGWEKDWKFGPLRIALEAWIEGKSHVNWRPPHFHGVLRLHGKAELRVFRFGVGLSVDAKLVTDVPKPFSVRGDFSVRINLPWPLPDFKAKIDLKWGPRKTWPPLPLPVQEVAVEHFTAGTTWRLMRQTQAPDRSLIFLKPNYDDGRGNYQPADAPELEGPASNTPVVPLDARPRITFSRPVHDDAFVGGNVQPPKGEFERVGDPKKNSGPLKVRFALTDVRLEAWRDSGSSWEVIADPSNGLYGSWAPVPNLDGGGDAAAAQNKLWLWSKNPFDYTARATRDWEEWFGETIPNYPCVAIPEPEVRCYGFAWKIFPEDLHSFPWRHPEENDLVFFWLPPSEPEINLLDGSFEFALCFKSYTKGKDSNGKTIEVPNVVTINLPDRPNRGATLRIQKQRVQVVAIDRSGASHQPFSTSSHDLELLIDVPALRKLELRGDDETFCILQLCIKYGLSDEEIDRRQRMSEHLREYLQRWKDDAFVLEPYRHYRLRVETRIEANPAAALEGEGRQIEFAYFRTEGPPGLANLSLPPGTPSTANNTLKGIDGADVALDGRPASRPVLDSPLNDLTLYVRQTIPPTVPTMKGERQPLPRPVYRAYDVGVEFAPDADVETMYRLARRDLTLQLFDRNNKPVRDALGRLVVLDGRWNRTDRDPLEDRTTRTWVTTVNKSTCASIDTTLIARPMVISASGQTLTADELYEARLVPLLLREDFGAYGADTETIGPSGHLGPWRVVDVGDRGGSSRWVVEAVGEPKSFRLVQKSDHEGGSAAGNDPKKPGAMLVLGDNAHLPKDHPDRPSRWTDYRFTLTLGHASAGGLGIVVRCVDEQTMYRFSMDRTHAYRRLVRMREGIHTVLAEDDFVFQPNWDYRITIEAEGATIRILQDGLPVFEAHELAGEGIETGTVGLYSWGPAGARFSNLRVDDLRQGAPTVYRFRFTTSLFANFFHQIHSFDERVWRLETAPGDTLGPARRAAIAPPAQPAEPQEAEIRGFGDLADTVGGIGNALRRPVERIEISRIERDGIGLGFLFRSPEPVDWSRTTISIATASIAAAAPEGWAATTTGAVKIADLQRSGTDHGALIKPNDEIVTLLLRQKASLSGYRVEHLGFTGPVDLSDPGVIMLRDDFVRPTGPLFGEISGPNSRDALIGTWEIIDSGRNETPSVWAVRHGALVQTGGIWGGDTTEGSVNKPGTQAVNGRIDWTDYRLTAHIRADAGGAIGIVFRYVDEGNHYRLSLGDGYTRLVRVAGGKAARLWQRFGSYVPGNPFTLTVDLVGDRIIGYLDRTRLFDRQDSTHGAGRIGLYSWRNSGARFYSAEVRALSKSALALFRDRFVEGSRGGFTIVDLFPLIPKTERIESGGRLRDTGDLEGPKWRLRRGFMRRPPQVRAEDSAANAVATVGSVAVAGSPGWVDYVATVRISPDANDLVGIVVRFVGPNDFYLFAIDTVNGALKFIRRRSGSFEALWERSTGGMETGKSYLLTLTATKDRFRGYLDGVPAFDVLDGTHLQGRIGLYSRLASHTAFSKVRVFPLSVLREDLLLCEPLGQSDLASLAAKGVVELVKKRFYESMAVIENVRVSEFRFSVNLRAHVDTRAMGVVFRYQDAKNYCLFSMDVGRKSRRLRKRGAGRYVSLASDLENGSFEVDRDYIVSVECKGERIRVWVDAGLVFEAKDPSSPTGCFGLWDQGGGLFGWIEAEAPKWQLLKAFDRTEDPLVAGAAVRILSGNEMHASNPGPHDRFVAELADPGVAHFTQIPVQVRLLDSEGSEVHRRCFVSSEAFEPSNLRLLRNADGTAFCALPSREGQLQPNIYRVNFQFRRGAIAGLLPLSQSGDQRDEEATVDFLG